LKLRLIVVATALAACVALPGVASAGTYKVSNNLTLQGHLKAIVKLGSSGGIPPPGCLASRDIKVQRKTEGVWKTVETGTTNGSGRYEEQIPDKGGKYRAVALAKQSGTTTCTKSVSDVETHHH
jgi:hypothetical protein